MWSERARSGEFPLRRLRAVASAWWQPGRVSCGFHLDGVCDRYNKINAGAVPGSGRWNPGGWNRTVRAAAARSGTVIRSHSLDLIRDVV